MKALSSVVLVVALFASAIVPVQAADKVLSNDHGDVSYQGASGAATPLAAKSSIALADNDFAITGANSLATLSLPDSSKVLIGDHSKVQLASFNQQPDITTAKFVIVGKVRFQVEHPGGAKANYTFQTQTGQIAVRGTVGEIYQSDSQLQVACYQLSDPALPVQVNLNNGKNYTLHAGQALTVAVAGAVIAAVTISAVSNSLVASSTATFGAAPAGGAAGGAASGAAAGAAGAAGGAAAPAAAAAAAAGAAGAVAVGGSHNQPASPPPPSPGPLGANKTSIHLSAKKPTEHVEVSDPHYHGAITASIDNKGVATVSPASGTGPSAKFTVSAVGGGKATLTITDGGSTVLIPINVSGGGLALSPTSVALSPSVKSAKVTASETFYTGALTFSASPSGIVSVSPTTGTGPSATTTVTAVSGGSATLTVTDANNNTASIPVTVSGGTLSWSTNSVTLSPGYNSAKVTASEPYYSGAFTFASDDTSIVNVNPSTGTGPSAQVTVSAVKGSAGGTAHVTVTDTYSNKATLTVQVSNNGTVKWNTNSLTFTQGYTSATVTASAPYYNGAFTFSNDNNKIVTISSYTGSGPSQQIKVTAVPNSAGGVAHITVTEGGKLDGRRTSTGATLTVNVSSNGTVAWNTASVAFTPGYTSANVTASEPYYNGSFTFASDNQSIVTLSTYAGSGPSTQIKVNAVPNSAGGTAHVTVTDANNNHASLVVTVNSNGQVKWSTNSLSLSPAYNSANVTLSEPYYSGKFNIQNSYGNIVSVSPQYHPSGPSAQLTISAVKGGPGGTASIVATDSTGTNLQTLTVTVSSNGTIQWSPAKVTLDPTTNSATVAVSEAYYSGSFKFNNDNSGLVTYSALSSSGPTAQVKVTAVPGTMGGTAHITATDSAANGASLAVTVQSDGTLNVNAYPATIVLDKTTGTITVGELYFGGQFTATPKTTDLTVSPGYAGGPSASFTVTPKSLSAKAEVDISDGTTTKAVFFKIVPSPTPTNTTIPICINTATHAGTGERMTPDAVRAGKRPQTYPTPSCTPYPAAGPVHNPIVPAPKPRPVGPQPPPIRLPSGPPHAGPGSFTPMPGFATPPAGPDVAPAGQPPSPTKQKQHAHGFSASTVRSGEDEILPAPNQKRRRLRRRR